MRRAARTPAPPNPSPYAPGGCTVSGPRLGQVLVTAAAVKMIRRATGGSILPSVVAVVDSPANMDGQLAPVLMPYRGTDGNTIELIEPLRRRT